MFDANKVFEKMMYYKNIHNCTYELRNWLSDNTTLLVMISSLLMKSILQALYSNLILLG